MIRRIFILSVVALAYLVFSDRNTSPIVHPAGILVPESPLQKNVPESVFGFDDYIVTRKASFEIKARVLSSEPYYFRRESDLSPIDLALGWGVMSDQAVLDRIDISQGGRWYHTRYEYPAPVSDQQIISSSSNMHMIPDNAYIAKALKKLRPGDIITLQGYLVDVHHESGWHWSTSMSRTDTGNGACEIVYVESLSGGASG